MLLGEGLHGGGPRTPPGLELCTLKMVTKCTGGPVPGWGLGLWGPRARQGRPRPQLRAWSKRGGNRMVEMGAEARSDSFSRWAIRAERCERVSLMEPSLRGTGQRDGGRWQQEGMAPV